MSDMDFLFRKRFVIPGLAGVAAVLLFGSAIAQNRGPKISAPDRNAAVAVNSAWIEANKTGSQSWPTVGLDYSEDRYSRLTQINTDTVKTLGLVWTANLKTTRGVEATPVVVGG